MQEIGSIRYIIPHVLKHGMPILEYEVHKNFFLNFKSWREHQNALDKHFWWKHIKV
jgi:hypothetical protein